MNRQQADAIQQEAIVIVAPSVNDTYYAPLFEQIIAYDIAFVNQARQHTNVVLVVDSDTMSHVQGKVPNANLIEATVNDIWARDFGPVFPNNPVQFRFRPDYMNSFDARWIENSFNRFTRNLDLPLASSSLILDGGNFVHDGVDKAIVTTRIFADNSNLSEAEVDTQLRGTTGVTKVAYIPEEPGDITGHADGMVMWLDAETLLVNEFDEPFRSQLLNPLRAVFPNATIIEIPVDYTYGEWQGFISACGLHINSLVTDSHIFLATYGQPNDAVVQEIIEAATDKTVVPIDASDVCIMGGAVRCLSWYAKGETAVKLLAATEQPNNPPATN
ncbi:MAG: agmatine deiminase family protein [Chloroflexota bacterium]